MADKPENQSQSQPLNQTQQSPTPKPPTRKCVLPTVDPVKTINYRQDGIDRSKK
jgi:hypothetical protein